jgi:hyperosmotically inducible periplasmic protein
MGHLVKTIQACLFTSLLAGTWMLANGQESTAPPPTADNTKTNQRDKNKAEPTADQQKENQSDRELTQQIRRAIVQDKSLSTYAHNVKIIAEDGMVTLKGPVRSEEEKTAVEAKASEIAGRDKVTSQLEVKPKQ